MEKSISEKFVRRAIIRYLERKGWARNLREKEKTEQGVDIRVRHNKYSRYFLIETKGDLLRSPLYHKEKLILSIPWVKSLRG